MSLLLDALKQAEQVKTKGVSSETEETQEVPHPAIGEEPASQNPKNSLNDDASALKGQLSKELPFEIEMHDARDQNAIDGFGDEFPFHRPKPSTAIPLIEADRDPDNEIAVQENPPVPPASEKNHEKIEDQPSLDILEKSVDQPIGRDHNTSTTEKPFPSPENEVIGDPDAGDARRAEDVLKITRNSSWNRASVLVVGLAVLMFACAGGYFYLLEQLPKPVQMPPTGAFNPIANDSFGISRATQPDSDSSKIAKKNPQLNTQLVFRNKPEQIESPRTNVLSEQPVDFPEVIKIRKKRLRAETGRWLSTAYQSYLRNDYDTAEWYYLRVLNRSPRNIDALLGLGSIAEKQGFAAKARRYYLKSLEQNPNNVYAKAALNRKADKLSPTEKESRLKTLIAEHPKSAGLYFSLGNHYAEQGQWAKAQTVYFQAATLEPQRPEYVLNLAVSMDHLAKPNVALQYYRKALGLAESKPTRIDASRVEKRIHQLTFQ